ncbi:MAG: N-acetylmannosamine-6-phosphate 2-epimerase [Erysipelotrichaceae bacterium]
MNKEQKALIESMKGLIVSCQTQPDDPIHQDGISTVVMMANAAKWGHASGLRANTPAQIKAIKANNDLPVIGLYKIWNDNTDVFITPTIQSAREVVEAGADILAIDCTFQINSEGNRACELIKQVKKEMPNVLIFADVSNLEEAIYAKENGADIVAPTLYGYTKETNKENLNWWDVKPNFDLLESIVKNCADENCYVMMEGHVNTEEEAVKCIALGAHSVVVGSAITRPHTITDRFNSAIQRFYSSKYK